MKKSLIQIKQKKFQLIIKQIKFNSLVKDKTNSNINSKKKLFYNPNKKILTKNNHSNKNNSQIQKIINQIKKILQILQKTIIQIKIILKS